MDDQRQVAVSDVALAQQIGDAVKASAKADGDAIAAAKDVGALLLEAKRRHTTTKAFEAFLKTVPGGLQATQAYRYIAIAGGSTTVEAEKEKDRERKRKERERKERERKAKEIPVRDVTDPDDSDLLTADNVVPLNLATPTGAAEEERWQRSLGNLAGDAVSIRAFWTREFGEWEKFQAPSDLVTLAAQAAQAWTSLAADLATPQSRAPRKAKV